MVKAHRQSKHIDVPEDFDDDFYLAFHSDVAGAVARGEFRSGFEHFELHGRAEHRAWSNKSGLAPFGRGARLGSDIFRPHTMQHFAPQPVWTPRLSGERAHGQLLILVSYLRTELFFAGYNAFFAECALIANEFADVLVVCLDDDIAPGILDRHLPGARVRAAKELSDGEIDVPDLVVTFDSVTTLIACDDLGLSQRTVYFCQDFEPGFYPFGPGYVASLRALHVAEHVIVSTPQLRDYLDSRDLLEGSDVCVIAPAVRKLRPRASVPRRIFVYFRPEAFNSRNMADYLMAHILDFCRHNSGYEFLLVGSVASDFAFTEGENSIVVLSKLDFDTYEDLLTSSQVVISLIYSAHPGVVAYQAALSGVSTITNVFDNRSAEDLQKLSPNLIPLDLVRDTFSDVFAGALQHIPVTQDHFEYGPDIRASSVEFMQTIARRASSG